jgi:hypothetical protein
MSTTHIPVSGNQSATISGMIARPQWLDEQLYPFQSRFVEIEGNRIHLKKSYRREMRVCTQPSTPDRDTSPLHHGAGWRGQSSEKQEKQSKEETRKALTPMSCCQGQAGQQELRAVFEMLK